MKAGAGISIIDLYEWLPTYGENSIIIESKGLDLLIKVEYDVEDKPLAIGYRELRFNMVCAFSRIAFPGIPISNINYASSVKNPSMGALVEYPSSETALAWRSHFGGYRPVKHYQIAFLSENILVEVFAGSVTLGDETIITNQ